MTIIGDPLWRKCSVCECWDHRVLFFTRLSPGSVVQCKECGMIFVNPVDEIELFGMSSKTLITESSNNKAIDSDCLNQYLLDAETKNVTFSSVLQNIQKHGVPSGRLLDVGCYCGLFLDLARKAGYACLGVEPDNTAQQYAVGNLGLKVFNGTLEKAHFESQSEDVVVMLQVLEHVLDPRAVLEECARVLRSNGLLVVEVPNIDCWGFRLLGRHHRHFAKHHINFFDPKSLVRLLESVGFEIQEVVLPTKLLSARRILFGLNLWYPEIAKLMAPAVNALRLDNHTVSLNLRDIVAVYARRL